MRVRFLSSSVMVTAEVIREEDIRSGSSEMLVFFRGRRWPCGG